ncbi:MAG: flagellar protein FliT [Burkholderiaceae bacterium]
MQNDLCEVAETTRPAATIAVPMRSRLLQHYEAIAQASGVMLAAARAAEWSEVARQEQCCCALIAALRAAHGSEPPLGVVDDQRRMQLLRQILSDDAQIRGQAEPWLEPFVPYISTPRQRQTHDAQ